MGLAVSVVVTPVAVTVASMRWTVPAMFRELSVIAALPAVMPPLSGFAARPKEQLLPAVRLTAEVMLVAARVEGGFALQSAGIGVAD